MATINYNERSWAIDLISDANMWLASRNLSIKRLGGENTLKSGSKPLFPDVLLFGDIEKGRLLQGWELKMPDTPIEDTEFIKNARIKAELLSLNSFLLWNVSTAVLYRIEESKSLSIIKTWNNLSHIRTRDEVLQYKKEINEMLAEILQDLNNFMTSGDIKSTSVVTVLNSEAVSALIQSNIASYVEALKESTHADVDFSNEVTLWWRYAKNDYPEEHDKFVVLARNNLLFLINKILFAHILKSYQIEASAVDTIDHSTDIKAALTIFNQISEKCDFWNIFQTQRGEDLIPVDIWQNILSFNDLLKEFNFSNVEKTLLHDLIGLTVYRNKRKFAGQFTTPHELAKFVVRLTIRDKSLVAIDPCCGTGTIAKEIYCFKKEQLDAQKSLETLWASDKFSLPLQMATFNLADPEALGTVLKVFREDVTNLRTGQEVELHEPFKGSIIKERLPKFSYIISNLPFVQQEDLRFLNPNVVEINEVIDKRIGPEFILDGRSDLYAYLPFYFWDLMESNGRVSVIVSNSWMGTAWGKKFYIALSSFFIIENISISGNGRWFKNAKVVSNIITLRRKDTPRLPEPKQTVKFTVLKKKLEDYSAEGLQEIIAIVSAKESVNEEDISLHSYSHFQMDQIQALGLNLNSFFADNEWILRLSDKLEKISTFFEIGRGERRGWDKFFYPEVKNNIEPEYLKPVLKTPRSINCLVAEPDAIAFCCDKSKEELVILGHTGALAWINSFEDRVNEKGVPLPIALARNDIFWYTMRPNTLAEMVTSINFGDRLYFARFETPTFVNQRLVRFTRKTGKVDERLCHALMNSLISLFYIEAMGTGRGEGALDLSKDKIHSDFRIINPSFINTEWREKILTLFEKMEKRAILPLEQELKQQDRIDFDNCVLEAIDCLQYKKDIENALLTIYRIRAAVNK